MIRDTALVALLVQKQDALYEEERKEVTKLRRNRKEVGVIFTKPHAGRTGNHVDEIKSDIHRKVGRTRKDGKRSSMH